MDQYDLTPFSTVGAGSVSSLFMSNNKALATEVAAIAKLRSDRVAATSERATTESMLNTSVDGISIVKVRETIVMNEEGGSTSSASTRQPPRSPKSSTISFRSHSEAEASTKNDLIGGSVPTRRRSIASVSSNVSSGTSASDKERKKRLKDKLRAVTLLASKGDPQLQEKAKKVAQLAAEKVNIENSIKSKVASATSPIV